MEIYLTLLFIYIYCLYFNFQVSPNSRSSSSNRKRSFITRTLFAFRYETNRVFSSLIFRSTIYKMLAVFDKSVAKSPDALQSPESDSVYALKDGILAHHFSSVYPGSVIVNLGSAGLLAYSVEKQNPLLPRYYDYLSSSSAMFSGIL